MPSKLRIALDMDEVLADTLAGHLQWFEKEFGYRLTPADLAGRLIEDVVEPEHWRRHEEALHEGSFFGGLKVMPGSVEVVRELCRQYDVFIASAAMDYPSSCGPKYDWLRSHFPFVSPRRFVFCGDKSVVGTDFLIDDLPRNVAQFRGQGILFSAPHNLGVEGLTRVENWDGVRQLLLGKGMPCDCFSSSV